MEEEQRLWESGVMNVEEPFGYFVPFFIMSGRCAVFVEEKSKGA